jgi:hypothetical protein
MGDAIQAQAQAFSTILGERVVKTNALDETTVTAIARIGNHYVVKGAVFSATTGKTNNNHRECLTN